MRSRKDLMNCFARTLSQWDKVVNRRSVALPTQANQVSTHNWVSISAAKWRTTSHSTLIHNVVCLEQINAVLDNFVVISLKLLLDAHFAAIKVQQNGLNSAQSQGSVRNSKFLSLNQIFSRLL